MRIKAHSELNGCDERLWVVQRWNGRGGWFDWSICTTLREAEEDYLTAIKQDEHDVDTRIVRVERVVEKESKFAR